MKVAEEVEVHLDDVDYRDKAVSEITPCRVPDNVVLVLNFFAN